MKKIMMKIWIDAHGTLNQIKCHIESALDGFDVIQYSIVDFKPDTNIAIIQMMVAYDEEVNIDDGIQELVISFKHYNGKNVEYSIENYDVYSMSKKVI